MACQVTITEVTQAQVALAELVSVHFARQEGHFVVGHITQVCPTAGTAPPLADGWATEDAFDWRTEDDSRWLLE